MQPTALAVVLALSACTTNPEPSPAPVAPVAAPAPPAATKATARLAPASGSQVSGELTFSPSGDGVLITGLVKGLTPNTSHGFHVHEDGDCSAPDASSARDRFNPAASPHGTAAKTVKEVSLGTGGINDVANRAVVVHAMPDDYRSQPAGNSGDRVACGVLVIAG